MLQFQLRNPADHPEDTNELRPFAIQLRDGNAAGEGGNLNTAAKIGVFEDDYLVTILLRGEDSDIPEEGFAHVFTIESPDDLKPFFALFGAMAFGADDVEHGELTNSDGNVEKIELSQKAGD